MRNALPAVRACCDSAWAMDAADVTALLPLLVEGRMVMTMAAVAVLMLDTLKRAAGEPVAAAKSATSCNTNAARAGEPSTPALAAKLVVTSCRVTVAATVLLPADGTHVLPDVTKPTSQEVQVCEAYPASHAHVVADTVGQLPRPLHVPARVQPAGSRVMLANP